MLKYLIAFLILFNISFAQRSLLDAFENSDGWKIFKSDGVEMTLSIVKGVSGNAIRIDYNFLHGTGYGGIQKEFVIDYPEIYQFGFYVKGESPKNNFEFKLLDESGNNVWWRNQRDYTFPAEWKKVNIKKRHLSFAWGPAQDKNLKRTTKIEFTIASSTGGKGFVLIDDLFFEKMEPADGTFKIEKTSINPVNPESELNKLFDKDLFTPYNFEIKDKFELNIELEKQFEISEILIHWDSKFPPVRYELFIQEENEPPEKVYESEGSYSSVSFISLPEQTINKLQLVLYGNQKSGIREIEIRDVSVSLTKNDFMKNVAMSSPRGYFPRYFYNEKSYWTITGVVDDKKEALINEEGMIEVDKSSFSLEPAVTIAGKVYNWNNVSLSQGLEEGYLPIPNVLWKSDNFQLETKTFAGGEANKTTALFTRYELINTSDKEISGNFHLLLRPVQVNPIYQFLNTSGGLSEIRNITRISDNQLKIDDKVLFLNEKPETIRLVRFSEGHIYDNLNNVKMVRNAVFDSEGLASGSIDYSFRLNPGEKVIYYFHLPLYQHEKSFTKNEIDSQFNKVKSDWISKLNRVKIEIAGNSKISDILRSNLAYILINKDNEGIQPGSRSYERSWMRDGSLTSSALLKFGFKDEVRNFINWYSGFQYPDGKIPCVVDFRGPDPVPENDSHGEYLFMLAQYFKYTNDTLTLKKLFNNVVKTVDYIEFLTNQRKTDHYRLNNSDSVRAMYGMMLESISHEGYSEKPMHSYWDNFFTMKGLKDAVYIADVSGEKEFSRRFSVLRDEFGKNLKSSIELAIKYKNLSYLPGCIELGDFDATSTTIALYPGNLQNLLPKEKLTRTFDKYYKYFCDRRDEKINSVNYTPYEARIIGSLILLGERKKAKELMDFLINDSRPKEWNHWAEVVWKDYRIPRFIGDMPHTWVGSDFINSVIIALAYEDDANKRLLLGEGLFEEWVDGGKIVVENLFTSYGNISFSLDKNDKFVSVKIHGDKFNVPANFIHFRNPYDKPMKNIKIDGENILPVEDHIVIKKLPAEITITY
ncbi:MAG: hypothetical protein AB9882_04480 [Ignavibacteriaceae bacterium]